jgi:DNA replication and repair protein RecF
LRVETLRLQNLRNYREAEFHPTGGTTLVVGDNGAGKSSLLEALALFATLASPRVGQLSAVVRDGETEGGAHMDPVDGVPLEIRVRGGRSFLKLGGTGTTSKVFLGRFRCVLFTPEDLDLVRGEPELRRRALDELLTQMRPGYRSVSRDAERALRQRNAALRQGMPSEAAIYDEPLAIAAAQILESRRELVQVLAPVSRELYDELAGRGGLGMRYKDTSGGEDASGADLVEHLRRRYAETLTRDVERGRTSVGPHRDDLEVEVDGRPARTHASRGEQRSSTLAFRLSGLRILEGAVLLLDDVLSELDPDRRRRVFDVTGDAQTILTATDRESVPAGAKVEGEWMVEGGVLRAPG